MENKDCSGILQLPSEIIEIICGDDCLSCQDICSVALTCTQLRELCQSNEVWKRKLQQRWSKLLIRYPRNKQYDWLNEYRTCHMIEQKVQMLLRNMSPTYYKLEELSKEAFGDFIMLMEEYNAGEIIINNLMELIHNEDKNDNLTIRYYAAKVLRHILHQHLSEKWKEHLSKPSDQQKLEDGAVLLSQWCQPTEDITQNAISDQLDSIAQLVVKNLPPNLSSSFNEDSGQLSWSPQQERVILETLNYTLFNVLSYFGNTGDYYNENNSYIDKVLKSKSGIPISLSLVYVSLARRLGVNLECVNYPTHFLLKWKEHPMASTDKQYTFIDPFHKGKFLPDSDVDKNPVLTEAVPPVKVYERMARNLIHIGRQQGRIGDNLLCLRNALEIYLLINPDDIDMMLLHLRINLHLSINLPEVKDQLQSLISVNETRMGLVAYLMSSAEQQMIEYEEKKNSKSSPKHRKENKEVEFSVGMVMKHKRYNYMCVIYGWDSSCQASREWIVQMGVHNLPKKDQQPFYNVLVEDGSNRYAAQENLLHPPSYCDIPHPEVGKYFQRFTGQFYVPNDEKENEYPDDTEFTQTQVTEVSLGRV